MIKYRVTDVAKDLQISNKAVIEAIEKYCGETKKAMTALNEHELDIVLETFTQGKSVKSLDAFFADNGQNEEQPDAPAAEAAPAPQNRPLPLRNPAKKRTKRPPRRKITALARTAAKMATVPVRPVGKKNRVPPVRPVRHSPLPINSRPPRWCRKKTTAPLPVWSTPGRPR